MKRRLKADCSADHDRRTNKTKTRSVMMSKMGEFVNCGYLKLETKSVAMGTIVEAFSINSFLYVFFLYPLPPVCLILFLLAV